MRVLFLISPGLEHNDNHLRLPAAFSSAGWQVAQALHEDVSWRGGEAHVKHQPLSQYQLIWPVGFGPARSFLDRTQLLASLPARKLVSAPQAQMHFHSKLPWLAHMPLSLVSMAAAEITEFMLIHGGEWILKPLAGSFGRDVLRVREPAEVITHVQGDQYWLLQRFLPEIEQGEMRSIVVEGQVIAAYRRVPTAGSFHANLTQGSTALPDQLRGTVNALVGDIAAQLHQQQIGFAAIDTCGEDLIEVNVANPGGLATLEKIYGRSFDTEITAAIAARFS